ncbi:MAG: metallophosphoesterase [Candidatus Aenigmarchaeota archaeon]|nr:metallophosphoesterase [Candidatus Aenigmarchaeota archaeon]
MLDLIERAKKSTMSEMLELCEDVLNLLAEDRKDGALFHLPSSGKATIIGDIHGDLESLSLILNHSMFLKNKDNYLIFLGDYGDRGEQSAEVYYTILSLKKEFPKNVILLRGNHEFPVNIPVHPHDLPHRLTQKFGKSGIKVYEKIRELFDCLLNAATLEKKYILLHGGLPVNLTSLDDIAFAHRTHPSKSFLEEILWNDPEDIRGFYPSPRGAGKIFGKDVTKRILRILGVKTLIRSHQPLPEGVSVKHDGTVLTISSTTIYGGKAAYLKIDLSEEAKSAYELSEIAHKF